MTTRRPSPQFDLFVPFVSDLPLRDQRETMERPFFSLAKRKRLKPIEYVSPAGDVFVNVYPNPEFGMATIWDADILIWAASVLNDMRRSGANDLPRTLHFQPYDLLKMIERDTGGREYRLLREGLSRLQATTITTNIRVARGKKQRQFSWIESWSDLVSEDGNNSRGMTLTLSDWFYEGVLIDGSLLAIDREYFGIRGGRERWLYRVARKHAGGAGESGFTISLKTLFEKSGAEGTYRRFKFEIQSIVKRDELPSYHLELIGGAENPQLRMVRRTEALAEAEQAPRRPRKAAKSVESAPPAETLPLFGQLADETLARVRKDFPGWDVYALQREFDDWVARDSSRRPADYQAAFYGFVRNYDAREG